jgi:hypothetical protein
MKNISEKEFGVQPLDDIMNRFGLSNTDLVEASTQQLTHKMVAKGRSGRRITLNVQHKILEAIRSLKPEAALTLKDIFNYS